MSMLPDGIAAAIPATGALPVAPPATCEPHPMGRALRLLGDTWTLMIVHNLLGGTKRYGELLEALGNVSPKTVSQRLKLLEETGFVQRQAFAEIPPRVEYSLTAKGRALVDIMESDPPVRRAIFGRRSPRYVVPLVVALDN